MSAEQVAAFLKHMADADFRTSFEAATTLDAKRLVLDKAGLTISVEDAEAALKGEGELDEQDLDQVTGGDAGVVRFPYPPPP